ncbi:citrate lyase acyl carrier protein [Dolosicoccus paucivorans]
MKLEIKNIGQAGTLESSDAQVIVAPGVSEGIHIELQSPVIQQFGEQMQEVVRDTLNKMNITNVSVKIQDQGALDCTLRARTLAAVLRAAGKQEELDWELIDKWSV